MMKRLERASQMLGFGDLNQTLLRVITSPEWAGLQSSFNAAKHIFVVGHGGNLAVADHAAIDISRLTRNTKTTYSPGSAIVATSLINDTSFDDWLCCWFKIFATNLKPSDCLIIGISSSGRSTDIQRLFEYAQELSIATSLITAKSSGIRCNHEVITACDSYHASEVVALALSYQLVHGHGYQCPSIK